LADTDDDPLVQHPTWFGQVRNFFTQTDIDHMGPKGVDLATYDGVVGDARSIFNQTRSGRMPPGGPRWSANRVQTFSNWMDDKFPRGTALPPPAAQLLRATAEAAPGRVRKEVTTLSANEVTALKTAFTGIMARDPAQQDSYFVIAGYHWFPAKDFNRSFHCLHHEDRFLAWHRLHLKRLEDALRSVPGCADVTLPYWDISTPIPPLLAQQPFAQYQANGHVGHGYDPLTTSRNAPNVIATNLAQAPAVVDDIATALKQSVWEQFDDYLIRAHDNGHDAIGPTMSNQDISAFDPVFWFFHCNLDRVWLQWQRSVGATTVSGFKQTCQGPTDWLEKSDAGVLPPFDGYAADTISMPEIDYAQPPGGLEMVAFENKTGNIDAAKRFRIDGAAKLSIRVKDIDRSAIPGTFVVRLLADGKQIARQTFFQPTDPELCPSCVKQAKVPIDFHVDPAAVLNKDLSVEIHVPSQKDIGTQFPLSKAGNPTINVRHLLEGE
jgi:tyrosinase